MTNITVLKDENLGGVEREYREVKRKADVGDRIKIIAACMSFGHYSNGDIMTITRVDSDGDAFFFVKKSFNNRDGEMFAYRGEYVVLEPAETIRINGARFRMVDRKAAVGERVIVTDVVDNYGFFSRGNIGIYKGDDWVDFNGQGNVGYDSYDGEWAVDDNNGRSGYRVLEPLESSPVSEPLSAKPASDQAAETIAKLTGRVSTLESQVQSLAVQLRVVREDCVLIEEGVSDDIRDFAKRLKALEASAKVSAEEYAASAQKVREVAPSIAKSPQEIRDNIVKRAEEDVADLRKFAGIDFPGDYVSFWPQTTLPVSYMPLQKVEYVVNRDKRTVVALIRRPNGEFITRGIAKCAPGDVFNVWIGKAIALRRALGLEIPEEYVSAPNPTEVRVGDIVKIIANDGSHNYDEGDIGHVVKRVDSEEKYATIVGTETNEAHRSRGGYQQHVLDEDYVIIDDSREDSAEQRKEVA